MNARGGMPVTQDEVDAGMISYAIECLAALGLVAVIVLTKVMA